MKKFISMVMAAAMVVSLVPATAFAANKATFKVVNAQEYTDLEAAEKKAGSKDAKSFIVGPQVQLKLTDVDNNTATADTWEIELDFAGAELDDAVAAGATAGKVLDSRGDTVGDVTVTVAEAGEDGDDSIKIKVAEKDGFTEALKDNAIVVINMDALNLRLTRISAGAKATVEVGGDFGDSEAITFASVLKEGIKVTLKKTADVVEEEVTYLEKDLVIEPAVGKFEVGQMIELKVNGGFEFTGNFNKDKTAAGADKNYEIYRDDDHSNKLYVVVLKAGLDKITVANTDIQIDAVSAKVGAVAKITAKAITNDFDNCPVKAAKGETKFGAIVLGKNRISSLISATATAVEAVKVIGEEVLLKVDTDADVPVIYSGVNSDNEGITNGSDHKSVEIQIKESAKGALDVKKAFTLSLPKGVFVTEVTDISTEGVYDIADMEATFEAAYKKGSHEGFEFARKTFTDTADKADKIDMKFRLELVAVPGFAGDVTLKLEGDAFEKAQEVVIAKFVAPYTVEAQSNDLIIDYRNTAVPTDVIVKEAEAGLWSKDLAFTFEMDKHLELEDTAAITVNAESGMKLKNIKDMKFTVKEESDDEAAVVTVSNISLYMNRNIAAGAYALKLGTTAGYAMMTESLATTEKGELGDGLYCAADYADWDTEKVKEDGEDVLKFKGQSATVKEGFVNVVTAGRDKDDASFTTKVVVPVGEAYIVAGETQIALDVPAYINAAGYTMLPVRAVATALGINNDNVIWSQAAKQVTVLYGQRIITMTVGEAMVYVNGSAIPASAAVEITDGRAFLGLRDLANALGVTTIDWNNETKTATLN